MFYRIQLADGSPAVIIVKDQAVERLKSTCFRGCDKRLAGNFMRWQNVEQVFADDHVRNEFFTNVHWSVDATEMDAPESTKKFNVTITHAQEVGWESTAPLDHYQATDLEPWKPNHKSNALRVKLNRTDILAPRTREVTMKYTLHWERSNGFITIIWSMYPGKYIGELFGDITQREKRVFFTWDHPGT